MLPGSSNTSCWLKVLRGLEILTKCIDAVQLFHRMPSVFHCIHYVNLPKLLAVHYRARSLPSSNIYITSICSVLYTFQKCHRSCSINIKPAEDLVMAILLIEPLAKSKTCKLAIWNWPQNHKRKAVHCIQKSAWKPLTVASVFNTEHCFLDYIPKHFDLHWNWKTGLNLKRRSGIYKEKKQKNPHTPISPQHCNCT